MPLTPCFILYYLTLLLRIKMTYLTHDLELNLKIPATCDGLFDMLNCIIVSCQTLFSFDIKGDISTH